MTIESEAVCPLPPHVMKPIRTEVNDEKTYGLDKILQVQVWNTSAEAKASTFTTYVLRRWTHPSHIHNQCNVQSRENGVRLKESLSLRPHRAELSDAHHFLQV